MGFNTTSRHHKYLGMPFVFMNAPTVFINEILQETLNSHECLCGQYPYLQPSMDEPVVHVRRVLQLLLENHQVMGVHNFFH